MKAQELATWLWFAKLLQMLSAMILTPEIIGPDRFDRLENYIASQDFSKKERIIWLSVFIAGFAISCPWIYIEATRISANVNREQWQAPGGTPAVFFFGLLYIIGLVLVGWPNKFTRLIQSALNRLASYLRRTSVFRSVAVALGVLFFFVGMGLELVIGWPF